MASGLTVMEFHQKYFDPKTVLSKYFIPEAELKQDIFTQRGERLARFFCTGNVKGDILIKYGGSFVLSSLLPACEFFNEIIIIDFLNSSIKMVDQWRKQEPGSFIPSELEKDRQMWIEKEEKIRKAIKLVINAEICEPHLVAPGLPAQADCILSEFCLEFLNKDKEGYVKALKSMASLLKLGGCLILHAFLDCTFYIMGSIKFPVICLSEEFVRKAVIRSGFAIKELHVTPRTIKTLYSTVDFTSTLLLIACKEKDTE
ncbi:nicotinamide N-methyltransferase-like [Lissotriton helveticus]